jgi:hypothetical protein
VLASYLVRNALHDGAAGGRQALASIKVLGLRLFFSAGHDVLRRDVA